MTVRAFVDLVSKRVRFDSIRFLCSGESYGLVLVGLGSPDLTTLSLAVYNGAVELASASGFALDESVPSNVTCALSLSSSAISAWKQSLAKPASKSVELVIRDSSTVYVDQVVPIRITP